MADRKDERKTVLIADDHPIFRAGIRQVIEQDGGFAVVGEADNGEETLQKIQDLKPYVAIVDIQMPKMTGLAVAQRASAMNLDTRIVLLTMLEDKHIFLEAMDSGIHGYVLKDSAVTEILRAISAVCEDKHYISPTLAGLLVQKRSAKGGELSLALKGLTESELKILRLIADLKSNREIADDLFISHRTVENHRVNITRKLNINGTNALLKFALQHKADLE